MDARQTDKEHIKQIDGIMIRDASRHALQLFLLKDI